MYNHCQKSVQLQGRIYKSLVCELERADKKEKDNIRYTMVLYLQVMNEDIYQGIINKNRAVCQPKVMPFKINLFPTIRLISTFYLW